MPPLLFNVSVCDPDLSLWILNMSPDFLRDNDLTVTPAGTSHRDGQIRLAFLFVQRDQVVKQIEKISPDRATIYVIGSHPNSIDSRRFGPIPKSALLGKVVWHVPRPQS